MPQSITVLLIDDNPADLMLAREAFSEHGDRVNVITHSDGLAALTYLRDTQQALPNVIVLDVNMPGMSGFEVLGAIREDPKLRHLPVVMLTTSSQEKDIDAAYDLITSSYMVKSAKFADFVAQIDQFVKYWLGSQFKRTRRP
ncbi:response regulator [Deinococcus sp. 6GRE01]|uniref:response regulator n=1 Tax=Deinococcus sp. 6GRE01 TaxID=2745873 RepID=UPI001E41172D|nr:response regulator [Deinococcus sp. 6GRE01]MCD0157045.1 response regulator [Deinococcus sp. 6GRE01]